MKPSDTRYKPGHLRQGPVTLVQTQQSRAGMSRGTRTTYALKKIQAPTLAWRAKG